ncbi:hypothetical protein L1049_016339 [Liquidambar formosana]|uniref:MADS-box domain-containing protein n=1 Tax=Liquidambar formosana TaxID=63359 RepID=A0AAP0S505_LIQFO
MNNLFTTYNARRKCVLTFHDIMMHDMHLCIIKGLSRRQLQIVFLVPNFPISNPCHGKKKKDIVKLECPKKRYVTFSKRHKRLYQKASTLCTLCDAQVAIIVFSPSGKPYEFGHPFVDSIIYHYLNGTLPIGGPTTPEEVALLRDIKEHEALLKEEREHRVLLKKENEDKGEKGKEKVEEWDDAFRVEEDLSLKGLQS